MAQECADMCLLFVSPMHLDCSNWLPCSTGSCNSVQTVHAHECKFYCRIKVIVQFVGSDTCQKHMLVLQEGI